MPKRHYVLAIACYLAIPVLVIAGRTLFSLIDPEIARGHADYVRNYRLLDLARVGGLRASWFLALILFIMTCYYILVSRQRSLGWLALAAAGPFGLIAITMLSDRSPDVEDRHQQFVRQLKMHWRIPLEIALFFGVCYVAYEAMVVKRDLMISYESFTSGVPVETIVAIQNESSGMWAFSEGNETMYLIGLTYLLLPFLFNLVSRRLKSASRFRSRC